MKRPLIHLPLIVLLLAVVLEAGHAHPSLSHFVSGEALIKFHPDLSPASITALGDESRAQVLDSIPSLRVRRLREKPGREQAMAEVWSALPEALYPDSNYRTWALVGPPNAPSMHCSGT